MEKLFTPFQAGDTDLVNRVVMAPMTRSRAMSGDTADELTAKYYQQRASAGLLITEGSQISVQGQGYLFTPGIYSDAQVQGWQKLPKRSTTPAAKFTFSSGTSVEFLTQVCRLTDRPPSVRWRLKPIIQPATHATKTAN